MHKSCLLSYYHEVSVGCITALSHCGGVHLHVSLDLHSSVPKRCHELLQLVEIIPGSPGAVLVNKLSAATFLCLADTGDAGTQQSLQVA